jgi:hypothetical protein
MEFLAASLPSIFLLLRNWHEIAFIAGALAVWGIVATMKEKWRKYRTRSWPTTSGAVKNVQVDKVDGGVNGVDYWKVSFEYSYRVKQEHTGKYKFNCTSEKMSQGAFAGMTDKTVNVHYKPSNEADAVIWEDEIWDIWWDTYWNMKDQDATAQPDPSASPTS